jgi:hypothetical protein
MFGNPSPVMDQCCEQCWTVPCVQGRYYIRQIDECKRSCHHAQREVLASVMLPEEVPFSFSSCCFYNRCNERVDLYLVLVSLLVIHQSLQLKVALTIHLFYSS